MLHGLRDVWLVVLRDHGVVPVEYLVGDFVVVEEAHFAGPLVVTK